MAHQREIEQAIKEIPDRLRQAEKAPEPVRSVLLNFTIQQARQLRAMQIPDEPIA